MVIADWHNLTVHSSDNIYFVIEILINIGIEDKTALSFFHFPRLALMVSANVIGVFCSIKTVNIIALKTHKARETDWAKRRYTVVYVKTCVVTLCAL